MFSVDRNGTQPAIARSRRRCCTANKADTLVARTRPSGFLWHGKAGEDAADGTVVSADLPDAEVKRIQQLTGTLEKGDVAVDVAFRSRSSIPSPPIPLFRLRCAPHDTQRKTRGRVDRCSFLVRILRSLLHAALSRRTERAISHQVTTTHKLEPTVVLQIHSGRALR
jgi:hypothetical protein